MQEGGLSRNSNPQAISATRAIYDAFLAKFPLFFGYWKKYADLEFAIAGTESAELVRHLHMHILWSETNGVKGIRKRSCVHTKLTGPLDELLQFQM